MTIIRFNQGSQKVRGVVQPRPTFAEKVRRIFSFKISLLSNRLTSSNLPRTHPRTPAYIHSRACVCRYIQVRQVRRLDSKLNLLSFFRPTSLVQVGRLVGGWA